MTRRTNTRILILGAGFGGVYTYKHLHKLFCGTKDVEIVIVNEHNYFLFTPFLHEIATGGISPEHALEPLRKLFPCCETKLHLARVEQLLPSQKMVMTSAGPIDYDYCVVALGGKTNYFGVKGADEHAFGLKSLADALRIKKHYIRLFERALFVADAEERRRLLRICIIGGGPTGVELAAEMAEFVYDTFKKLYGARIVENAEIILLHRDTELIGQFSREFRRKALRTLRSKGVTVRLETSVGQVASDHVILSTGERIETSTVVWVAGVTPYEVNSSSGLTCDAFGRMSVRQTLQHVDFDSVFALGDCACFTNKGEDRPVPALAQVAVKQASVVAENIYRHMNIKPLKTFYYKPSGMLISLGRWMACAEIGPFKISGPFAWWLWRTIYLGKILSFEKRIRITVDWTIDSFAPRDISEF
ncbi:MAG: NAD(P)/FAD-dependent oxidoreductase [Patescibacteria group bacterium]